MSVTMPTLDLGELGAQFDAAVRDDPTIPSGDTDESAATPETPGEAPDDAEAEAAPSDAPPEPAGVPEAEVEARVKVEVQKALSGLQRKLDPQIAEWRRRATDLREHLDEASQGVQHLVERLAEYDPEAAEGFLAERKRILGDMVRGREVSALRTRNRDNARAVFYHRTFGPESPFAKERGYTIDPEDPLLLNVYRNGTREQEQQALDLYIRERDLDRRAAAPPAAAPGSAATPERNAQGQFVSPAQAKAAATREREQARGHQPLAGGGQAAPREKIPTAGGTSAILEHARKVFQRDMARLQ